MPEKRVSDRERKIIAERADFCCEYCHSQERFATQLFSVEHIIPRSRGGKTVPENLALSCQGCNAHKYTKTEGYDPVSRTFVPLYHPREHKWDEHFRWNNDFSMIAGMTPTGRATVECLKLNREGLVSLRQVLYAMGRHPLRQSHSI